jgi:MFS transporter, ACS family, hexuronate transporter
MGIINAGTSVGAVIAPPLIALVLLYSNWRWIFVVTGLFGLLWVGWWRLSYTGPTDRSVGISDQSDETASKTLPTAKNAWIHLLQLRETWGLMAAKFLSDAAWFFYLFWLPKYLYDARGFDVKAVGALAWMPSAAAGIGCLVGGGFSSYLVRRNFALGAARKWALGLSAAVMPFVILVPHVAVSWAIALFCLGYFGQQSWSTLVMVLPTDLFPQKVVGSVAGLVGFGGAMGGIVFGEVAGWLLDHGFGYSTVFGLAGLFHVTAFLIILIALPTIAPQDLGRTLRLEAVR